MIIRAAAYQHATVLEKIAKYASSYKISNDMPQQEQISKMKGLIDKLVDAGIDFKQIEDFMKHELQKFYGLEYSGIGIGSKALGQWERENNR